MIRIAHVSDLHIGAELKGAELFDPVEAPYDAIEEMAASIEGGGYDAVIIAGDVYDRAAVGKRPVRTFRLILERFEAAELPVALISGNHDAEDKLFARTETTPNTWVARAKAPTTLVWHDLGVAVHAQSIKDPNEPRDLAAGYPTPLAGLRNIGVLHTSLTGEHSRRDIAPTTLEVLEAKGYDYWALGHVHNRMLFGNAAYSGSPYGRRKSEAGPHGYNEVRLRSSGVKVVPIDTAPFTY